MANGNEKVRRRKGRPEAPHQIERLAIMTHRINEGMTAAEAASINQRFAHYDVIEQAYVADDESNSRLPQTPEGRRTTLMALRKKWSKPVPSIIGGEVSHVPLGFRLDRPLERGRPKKR